MQVFDVSLRSVEMVSKGAYAARDQVRLAGRRSKLCVFAPSKKKS
jgi:hypothetical protein